MSAWVKGRDVCDTPVPVNALPMPSAARRMPSANRLSAYAIPPCMRNHWSSESPSVSSGSSASANSSFSISSNLVWTTSINSSISDSSTGWNSS